MTVLTGIHHVALTVTDLERSISWYQATLDLEVLFREEGDTRQACVMHQGAGGFSLGLVQFVPSTDEPFDPTRIGLDHVAFTVATMDDLHAWGDRLTKAGIEHSGAIDVPPGAILNFKDPDGIALSLFWDRAES